jgi:hypothetical protein
MYGRHKFKVDDAVEKMRDLHCIYTYKVCLFLLYRERWEIHVSRMIIQDVTEMCGQILGTSCTYRSRKKC